MGDAGKEWLNQLQVLAMDPYIPGDVVATF